MSTEPNALPDDLPEPQLRAPRRRPRPSLIWLVPALAGLAGLLLVMRAWLAAGPTITLSFQTAEGLEAGKTELRFKDVVIGKVRTLRLSEDRSRVLARVDLVADAADIAVADSEFWVVRMRADLGGISGFSTLMGGTYIGVNRGVSRQSRREFVGLEKPPAVTRDRQGRKFMLRTADFGSLNLGSPVYFRRLPVGRIASLALDEDGQGVSLIAFVDAPYDRLVTPEVRFWNASGLDLTLDASGLKLDTQSVVTLLAGGVAFQAPPGKTSGTPAADGASFELHATQAAALAPDNEAVLPVRMRFNESIRGLAVDAPVDFKGVPLGRITAVELVYDAPRQAFAAEVLADLHPQRLGRAYAGLAAAQAERDPRALFAQLVTRGLSAQLRAGNLITGQLYVALDLEPDAARARSTSTATTPSADDASAPLKIPTRPASLDQIQTRLTRVVERIDRIPFDSIGLRLQHTLEHAEALMRRLEQEVAPAASATLDSARSTLDAARSSLAAPEAPLQQDLHRTLDEVERTARSLRELSDSLQRHPQSLLRGRPEPADDPPAPSPPGHD